MVVYKCTLFLFLLIASTAIGQTSAIETKKDLQSDEENGENGCVWGEGLGDWVCTRFAPKDAPPCEHDWDCGNRKRCDGKGKCVSSNKDDKGAVCQDDSECGSKECYEGKCIIGGGRIPGVSCSTDSDCQQLRCTGGGKCMAGGMLETCNLDTDCPALRCTGGRCANASSNRAGAGCWGRYNSTEECRTPRKCNTAGKCVVESEANAPAIQGFCVDDKECETQSYCWEGACRSGYSPSSIACSSNEECTSSLHCFNGKCEAIRGTATCTEDQECLHKRCVGESCNTTSEPGLSNCESTDDCKGQSVGESSLLLTSDNLMIDPSIVTKELSKVAPSFVWGQDYAPINIAVFHDLSCGQCKRAHENLFWSIMDSHINATKVKVSFYEFPLIIAGKEIARHHAVLCANEQGKYLAYLEKIYENFKGFQLEKLGSYASSIPEIDIKKWVGCMTDAQRYDSKIEEHVSLAKKLGVDGTPTIFVNGAPIANFKSSLLEEFAMIGTP